MQSVLCMLYSAAMQFLPLSSFPRVATGDPEIVRKALGAAYNGADVDINPHHEFSAIHNCIEFDRISVHYAEMSTGFRLRTSSLRNTLTLYIVLEGEMTVHARAMEIACTPGGCAAMLDFPRPVALTQRRAHKILFLRMRRHALEDALTRLLGSPIQAPLVFTPAVDLASPGPRHLCALLTRLVELFDREPAMLRLRPLAARYEDLLLAAILTCLPHNHRHRLDTATQPGVPKVVRMAEAYLEANAEKTLRMADLARSVGMGTRSIQMAFRRHRGYSPSHFLRECRLARARHLLAQAAPGTTVLAVALTCGFGSQSHFTLCYRNRFGETPYETLRKSCL